MSALTPKDGVIGRPACRSLDALIGRNVSGKGTQPRTLMPRPFARARTQAIGRASYRDGCVVGFHSRASFCASAICAGVISFEKISRLFAAAASPFAAAIFDHIYPRTKS
jgi:hypothetical protein